MKCKGCGVTIDPTRDREAKFQWHFPCVIDFIAKQTKRIEQLSNEKSELDNAVNNLASTIERQQDQLTQLSRRQTVAPAPDRYQPSGSRGAVPRMDLTLEEMRAMQIAGSARQPVLRPPPPPPPQTTTTKPPVGSTAKDRFELIDLD